MPRMAKIVLVVVLILVAAYVVATRLNINPMHTVGDPLDQYNGVTVFYNGAVNNVTGRELTNDGYNLGLKYQCVEFVKRYYYERFGHKMPNSMGHAKEFYSPLIPDGALNPDRMLLQFQNGSIHAPMEEDLIVFAPSLLNRYGHVAIVSEVGDDYIEIVQQNAGPFGTTRERYPLDLSQGIARVDHERVLGWLRLEQPEPSLEEIYVGDQ
jgi:hypothetical protein